MSVVKPAVILLSLSLCSCGSAPSAPVQSHVQLAGSTFLIAGQSNAVSAGGQTWAMLPGLLNRPMTFVNVAHDGSDLTQWATSFHVGLENQLTHQPFAAVLWVQGEEDGYEKTDAETCYQDMRTVIDGSRVIQPGLPWFVSLDGAGQSPYINLPTEQVPVRQAQERLIREGVVFQGVDFDSLRSDPNNFDKVFFDLVGPGYLAHAQLWQAVLAPYLGE